MDKCKRCRYNKENTEIINYDEMYKEQKIIVRGYCECNRCGYIRPNSFYVKYFDLSDRYMVNKYNINLAAIRRPKNSSPGDKYFCNICNRETYLYYINTDYYNCPYSCIGRYYCNGCDSFVKDIKWKNNNWCDYCNKTSDVISTYIENKNDRRYLDKLDLCGTCGRIINSFYFSKMNPY